MNNPRTKHATLARLRGGENLRTDSVTGYYIMPPAEGQSFMLFAESLSPEGNLRIIQTSPVQSLTEIAGGEWLLTTENSTYGLTVHPEAQA